MLLGASNYSDVDECAPLRRGLKALPAYGAGAFFRSWCGSRPDKGHRRGHDHLKLRQSSGGKARLRRRSNATPRNSKRRGVGCSGNLAGGAWGSGKPHACCTSRSSQDVKASSARCHSPSRRTTRPPPGRGRGPWRHSCRLRLWELAENRGVTRQIFQRTTELQGSRRAYMHTGGRQAAAGASPGPQWACCKRLGANWALLGRVAELAVAPLLLAEGRGQRPACAISMATLNSIPRPQPSPGYSVQAPRRAETPSRPLTTPLLKRADQIDNWQRA